MRKILLATTALAAFAGFSSAANAQITVTLGGYTEFLGAIYDNNAPNGTEREFQLETEILIKADGKADNGLLYGAKVELQNNSANGTATNGIATDEASIYLAGFWGRAELGDFDGAADTLAIYAPLVGVEGIDGDYTDFLVGGLPTGSLIKAPDSSDATKVMYVTPRVAGFQAGFSYTPENGNEAQSVVPTKNTSLYSDFLEYGINYADTFSGVSVAASATGTSANGKGFTSPTNLEVKNFSAWQVGAQVGYAGFKVGGGYFDADDFNVRVGTNSGDQHVWNAGASYTTGPVAIGLSYANAEGYKSPTSYADEYQVYGLSGAYTIAPGLLLMSDLMFVDEELKTSPTATAKTDSDNYVWLISTKVSF